MLLLYSSAHPHLLVSSSPGSSLKKLRTASGCRRLLCSALQPPPFSSTSTAFSTDASRSPHGNHGVTTSTHGEPNDGVTMTPRLPPIDKNLQDGVPRCCGSEVTAARPAPRSTKVANACLERDMGGRELPREILGHDPALVQSGYPESLRPINLLPHRWPVPASSNVRLF